MTEAPAKPRTFTLGDILTVTTDRLLSERGIDGLYDLLNYMTGDNLMTHQLPRAGRECAPVLRRQHPALADITPPAEFKDTDHVLRWLNAMKAIHGDEFSVEPMAAGEHKRINPIDELVGMVGPERVIVAVVGSDKYKGTAADDYHRA